MFNVYRETYLGNGLYSIMERHHESAERGVMMYLVIGSEKAALEKRVAITTYRDGLKRFLGMINDDTAIYWGHGAEPVSHSIPENMMKACQEVLDGKTENDTLSNSHFSKRPDAPKANMMQHVCGDVMLVYNADTL